MFARALLVFTAVAACVAHAELATYTPAVLYAPGVATSVAVAAPVAAAASEPRALVAELLAAAGAAALAADERTVFVVERTGLSAQALAALSPAFVAETPAAHVEAAYTNGADVRAFDRTFGCGQAGTQALGAFLADDARSAGAVAAVCVRGEGEALAAIRAVAAARPTAAVVYTGAAAPEARVGDDEDTTIWTGPVAETIVTAIVFVVPMWIVFHLLCSIRPVEDVEYPKHKIA